MIPRALVLLALLVFQEPDLDQLIKQLSDDSIDVREKAAAALVELGGEAEERIRREAASAGGELKGRLEGILMSIDSRRKVEAVLPPLRTVTLDAKDRPLQEVIDDFTKQSGVAAKLAKSSEA